MYLFFFLLLLAFSQATQQAQIHSEITSPTRRQSRIFRWGLFGCICYSDAVVHPISHHEQYLPSETNTKPTGPAMNSEDDLTLSITGNRHSTLSNTENRQCLTTGTFEFLSMMIINPLDSEAIDEQYMICERRNQSNDRLSNLCFELIMIIKDFLEPEDIFKLRCINRRFLLHHLTTSRFVLYKALRPRITEGFECLYNSSHSAECLNSFIPQIACLLSESTRPEYNSMLMPRATPHDYGISNLEANLGQTNNLKQLVLLALHFYRRNDINLFWLLLDAVVKGQLNFGSNEFILSFGFGSDEMLIYICRNNLNSLGKRLLRDFSHLLINDVFYSGCLACLNGSNFFMFKLLIKKITKHELKWNKLSNLFQRAMNLKLHHFAEFMLETFPFQHITSPESLFLAISMRDFKMTELLLKYRKSMDLREISPLGYNMMELAANSNFVDGIVLLQSIASSVNFNFFKSIGPLGYAIKNKAHDAVSKIIEIVTENSTKPLDRIYSHENITLLLCTAIRERELASLKLILQNIDSHDIKHFVRYLHDIDEENNSELFISSLLHFCIQSYYEEGFDVLVGHFRKHSLEITDRLGRTPFLLAVTLGYADFVCKIAKLNPESVHCVDINRNNALHITLNLYHSKAFLKLIVYLGIDIHAKNNANISPLEMVLKMSTRTDFDNLYELYEILLSGVHESQSTRINY